MLHAPLDVPADPPEEVPAPARRPARGRVRGFQPPRGSSARRTLLVRAATLAAAATLGVFVGLGVRSGASLSRLGVVTLRLRGLPEFVSPDRGAVGAAMLGGLHVVIVGGVWGAAAGALAAALHRLGRGPAVVGAAALALGAAVTALDIALPIAFRIGAGSLTWGERALVGALTMLAGVVAARFATEDRHDAS